MQQLPDNYANYELINTTNDEDDSDGSSEDEESLRSDSSFTSDSQRQFDAKQGLSFKPPKSQGTIHEVQEDPYLELNKEYRKSFYSEARFEINKGKATDYRMHEDAQSKLSERGKADKPLS